jgi:hypothetical protein
LFSIVKSYKHDQWNEGLFQLNKLVSVNSSALRYGLLCNIVGCALKYRLIDKWYSSDKKMVHYPTVGLSKRDRHSTTTRMQSPSTIFLLLSFLCRKQLGLTLSCVS